MLRKQRKPHKSRKSWMVMGVLGVWSVCCLVSTLFVINVVSQQVDDLALENARAVFQTVVDFRTWNASHGGVFVLADSNTQPNPYLPKELRLVKDIDGKYLVRINPAYMTRKVGEISKKSDGPIIRVTSLKPIRLQNAPMPWERSALLLFDKNRAPEYVQFITLPGEESQYHYAAPLVTRQSCLKCHQHQGYRVGDIRGAVTVTLAADNYLKAKASHRKTVSGLGALVWILGAVVIGLVDRAARVRRRSIKKLQELSLLDPLTGLNNRRGFVIRAEQALRTLARDQGTAVLAFADLDGFKKLNDTLGHQEGDAALVLVGESLKSTFRESDVLARIGGDEFAALLVDASWDRWTAVQQRIDSALDQANDKWNGAVPLGLSAGLVPVEFSSSHDIPQVQQLLSQADKKMYEMKKHRKRKGV